ncbi:MAG: DEAD/DEAH box helicase [bacterium]|nr:DEAD/DEAH box helicase [bacterium]
MSPRSRTPRWVHRSVFFSISRSSDELSIVCEDHLIPDRVRCERGWSAIKVAGTLDLSLIGVLASLAQPLAAAGIGLFTVSTYDTDYLLVRESKLDSAIAVLEAAGHRYDAEPVEEPAAEPEEQQPEVAVAKAEEPDVEPTEAAPVESVPEEPELVAVPSPVEEDEPASDPEKPRRKSAFARVLAEFGLGDKDDTDPSLAAEVEPAAEETEPVAEETVAAPEEVVLEIEPEPVRATSEPAAEAEESETHAEPATEDMGRAELWTKTGADAGAEAAGLFTGAIAQNALEITDKSFEDLGLSEPILETVRQVGFEHPTPIQVEVIPWAREGRDVIGLAETGSGKTAAFGLPLAERLTHGRGTRGLILCPTREIALQTKAFLDIFGRDHELETVAVIGGVRMGPQIDGFRRDADILVATPGRLADHIRRGNVRMDLIEELVLDEADHMLDLGFLPQIKEILEQVPTERRTLMFSATMPPPIERLAQIFMNDPVRCDIRPKGQIATGIEHRLYLVKDEDLRKDCLFALLREVEGSTLIFVRRKLYTEWLARQLELADFHVARIHSDRSQAQRVEALRTFREGKVRILAATDVAARGIDVPRIQHVVNFGLPEQVEDYVQRSGRTARGSAAGIVSTIGTWQDKMMVREIELDLGIKLPRCTVEGVEPYVELPKRKQVRRRRLL